MTTDNRTNEPTEAQVEAAAREWYEQANGYETWASASGKHQQVVKVRAARALVAAARVPVQGEPNDDRTPEFEAIEQELFKHQPLLSMQDGSIRGCKCMDRVFYNQAEDWGTHLAEVFDALAAAVVQPSSTVDEVVK